ncbi:cytochrome c oxidase subunit CcoM [Atopomonas sediminilitoris]|nr:cytochrome c oxidase subunit CcoM [Atopomonas sediminilitoris]
MFVDEVVLAGVLTVGLMVGFLGAVGYFIWKDAQNKSKS